MVKIKREVFLLLARLLEEELSTQNINFKLEEITIDLSVIKFKYEDVIIIFNIPKTKITPYITYFEVERLQSYETNVNYISILERLEVLRDITVIYNNDLNFGKGLKVLSERTTKTLSSLSIDNINLKRLVEVSVRWYKENMDVKLCAYKYIEDTLSYMLEISTDGNYGGVRIDEHSNITLSRYKGRVYKPVGGNIRESVKERLTKFIKDSSLYNDYLNIKNETPGLVENDIVKLLLGEINE